MISINTKQVLQRKQQSRDPHPLVKIRQQAKAQARTAPPPPETIQPPAVDPVPSQASSQQLWLHSLQQQFQSVKVARNKLSSQIARQVRDGATQEQLQGLYAQIESFRPEMESLYDKIQHVKRYGHLPPAQKKNQVDESRIESMKLEKRRLQNLKAKLTSKLKKSAKEVKPDKRQEWEEKLSKTAYQLDELHRKIREINERTN